MTEKELYGTFNSIFATAVSAIPELKVYHVSPNYGRDVNTENLEQFLKDENYGIKDYGLDKYPICVCMTPKSRIIEYGEVFYFSVFFLRRSSAASINYATNQSEINIYEDWSYMKEVALKFLAAIKMYYSIPKEFSLSIKDGIEIKRISNVGADNISGVVISFNLNFGQAIC